ncbi:MAG TPA: hypothetical protein VGI83_04745, partial [Gemmatimonadales bacterium]
MTWTRATCLGALVGLVLAGCSHRPPENFAPDPGLVSHIKAIRFAQPATSACPGQIVQADYYAELDDGRIVTFATQYDEDHPPPLHVMFLGKN